MKKAISLFLIVLSSCIIQHQSYTVIDSRNIVGFITKSKSDTVNIDHITYGNRLNTDGRFNIGVGSYIPMMYGYPNVAFTSFWRIKLDSTTIGNHPLLPVYLGCTFTRDTITSGVYYLNYTYQYKDLIIEQNMYKLNKDKEVISEELGGQYYKVVYNFYNLGSPKKLNFEYLLDFCLDANDNALAYDSTKVQYKRTGASGNVLFNNEFNNTEETGLTTYLSTDMSSKVFEFRNASNYMLNKEKEAESIVVADNSTVFFKEIDFTNSNKQSVHFIYGLKDKSYIRKNHAGMELGVSDYNKLNEAKKDVKIFYFEKSNQTTLSAKDVKDIKSYIFRNNIKYCYVEAFSDAKGDTQMNYILSKKRATEIKKQIQYLCTMNLKYYGEQFADQSESSQSDGKLADRKVVITFIK